MSAEPDSVAQITQIVDHVSSGIALFYRQFSASPKLQALAAAWLAQVQLVENALWALLVSTSLATATGAALDRLGAILGFGRGILADADYRAALQGVGLAHRSSGRAEDLIGVMRAAAEGVAFSYAEGGASALLEPHAPLPYAAASLAAVLALARAAGVQLQLKDPHTTEDYLFTFSTDPLRSVYADGARGLADVAETLGGRLTGVVVA